MTPIVITDAPPNTVTVSFEKMQYYTCQFQASAYEPVHIEWFINGHPPPPDSYVLSTVNKTYGQLANFTTTLSKKQSLKSLKSLLSSASSEFICQARNTFRKALRSFHVNVQSKFVSENVTTSP